MKKSFYLPILLVSLLTTACNQDKIDELSAQNKELNEISSSQNESIEEMLASFNQIQENLNEIKNREGIIEIRSNDDTSEDIGKNISNDINAISELMKKNESLIKELNQKLKTSDVKMGEFRKLIKNLNEQVATKNIEIEQLNNQLKDKKILIGQLYFKNDSLSYEKKITEKKLENVIDEMNEVFFAYGTFKELKEKNVLTKEGGFLGLGKSKELKDDFNKEYFSRVDKRNQKSFLLYADEAKLITTHPSNSYEIMGKDGRADSLVIKDVDAFWNASKYLVIVVN